MVAVRHTFLFRCCLRHPSDFPGWVLLLLCLNFTPGYGQDTPDAFTQGAESYQAGDFTQALVHFQQAEAEGHISGALYYNIGNTYFRLNQLGRAILYYERARRLIPGDELLQHSLTVAQRRTLNEVRYLPRPFWIQWWNWIVAHLGTRILFFIGLLLYATAGGLLGYRIWTKTRNPWIRRWLSLTALGGVLLIAAAFTASMQQAANQAAVIIEVETNVRDFPSEQAVTLVQIHEGMVVDIIDSTGTWVEIYLPDGTTGWVKADHLEDV